MNRIARISFQSDRKIVDIIRHALEPELQRPLPRTTVDIRVGKDVSPTETTLQLEIQAKDLSALRAALNSYLRWIKTALDVKNSI